MPRRTKIVSGKVIAAVAQSKARKQEAKDSSAEAAEIDPAAAEPTTDAAAVSPSHAAAVATTEIDYSVDLKTRFQQRKDQLQQQRHADSEDNLRRLQKRREKEAKKKQRSKLQKRPVEGTSQDLEAAQEAKKSKSASEKGSSGLAVEEGQFQFNRLDDTDLSKPDTEKPKKKTLDPKSALKKLEAEKAKLQKLKEADPEKAADMEAKMQVRKALQKAQGIAVKDNESLLKKSIARREKQKEKSRQLWEKKKGDLKKNQEERQSKRMENIQARIEAKKAKKKGLKVKKPKKAPHKGKSKK